MDISPTARIRSLITTKEPIKTTLSFRSETRQNINVSNNTRYFRKWTNEKLFQLWFKIEAKIQASACTKPHIVKGACYECGSLTTEMLKVNADHDTHTKKGTKYRYRIKSNEHSSTTQLQISKSICEVTCTYDVLVDEDTQYSTTFAAIIDSGSLINLLKFEIILPNNVNVIKPIEIDYNFSDINSTKLE